jgi:hypothetical protein
MIRLTTFEDRFDYLRIGGTVGRETFGYDRHLNQRFYRSYEWKRTRDEVIARDLACDLAVPDREIWGDILVHHINPMLPDDIIHGEEWILDPEFLVTTTIDTHNAIHYGTELVAPPVVTERRPGDTKLW